MTSPPNLALARAAPTAPAAPFTDPRFTADGARRAHVALRALDTLWFNTGTLCNIACSGCYIASSPRNDALVYLTCDDARPYLDEIAALGWKTREIGFTGGEPFMNPNMEGLLRLALERGFETLTLTNAMRPMMRPRVQAYLRALRAEYGDKLALRVSLDSYEPQAHEAERGAGSWRAALDGLRWLTREGFSTRIAGRARFHDSPEDARARYQALFAAEGVALRLDDPQALVVFPEMDPAQEATEITEDCWKILGKNPDDVMCASSRMVVRRKGAAAAEVLSCTLLPYDMRFSLGRTLAEAQGATSLNHPYCSQFCVLGGASCS